MFGMGTTELLVILGVALLLFGAKRIPEVARSLGKSLNAFKEGMRDVAREPEETKESEDTKKV